MEQGQAERSGSRGTSLLGKLGTGAALARRVALGSVWEGDGGEGCRSWWHGGAGGDRETGLSSYSS